MDRWRASAPSVCLAAADAPYLAAMTCAALPTPAPTAQRGCGGFRGHGTTDEPDRSPEADPGPGGSRPPPASIALASRNTFSNRCARKSLPLSFARFRSIAPSRMIVFNASSFFAFVMASPERGFADLGVTMRLMRAREKLTNDRHEFRQNDPFLTPSR